MNKNQLFNKGHPELLSAPLRLSALDGVKSMLVNPRDGNDHGIDAPAKVDSPRHEEELNRVIEARMDVAQGKWPERYFEFCDVDPEPAGFLTRAGISTDDPQAAANFVRMDTPGELWNAIVRWAGDQGIPLRYEQPNCIDFLGRYVHAETYFHNLCSERMEIAFEIKAQHLRPRPEELVCYNLPQYPCPNHAESPAGHGTFAGCAYKAFIDTHLPEPHQDRDVWNGCLMLAHLRDIAGMHLRESSRNGVEMGRGEIGPPIRTRLPSYITRWARA